MEIVLPFEERNCTTVILKGRNVMSDL